MLAGACCPRRGSLPPHHRHSRSGHHSAITAALFLPSHTPPGCLLPAGRQARQAPPRAAGRPAQWAQQARRARHQSRWLSRRPRRLRGEGRQPQRLVSRQAGVRRVLDTMATATHTHTHALTSGVCQPSTQQASHPAAAAPNDPPCSPPIKSSRLRFFLAAGSPGAAQPPAAGAAAGTLVCGGRERGAVSAPWVARARWTAPQMAAGVRREAGTKPPAVEDKQTAPLRSHAARPWGNSLQSL